LTKSVAGETAGFSEFIRKIDRRNHVARRQLHQLIAPAYEEGVGGHEQRTRPLFDKSCKGSG
jgi:hypothetical protein